MQIVTAACRLKTCRFGGRQRKQTGIPSEPQPSHEASRTGTTCRRTVEYEPHGALAIALCTATLKVLTAHRQHRQSRVTAPPEFDLFRTPVLLAGSRWSDVFAVLQSSSRSLQLLRRSAVWKYVTLRTYQNFIHQQYAPESGSLNSPCNNGQRICSWTKRHTDESKHYMKNSERPSAPATSIVPAGHLILTTE